MENAFSFDDCLRLAEHRFDVVAVGVENESGIIARGIRCVAQRGRAVVGAARTDTGGMEGVDLLPAVRSERCVLFLAVWMETG